MSKQWIAVADEKPEIDGLNVSIDCLVKSNGESLKGFYHYRNECWYCLEPPFIKDHFRKLENVTHWRHINEPAPATPLPQTEVGEDEVSAVTKIICRVVEYMEMAMLSGNTELIVARMTDLSNEFNEHYTITKKQ